MEIFSINETSQAYDMEHWQHWANTNQLQPYYATYELAEKAMYDLLTKKLENVRNTPNLLLSKKYHENNIINNKINIIIGTNDKTKTYDLYTIKSHTVITE